MSRPALRVAGLGDVDPDRARELLERELARSPYQESLVARFQRWFSELLDRLGEATSGSGALGVVTAVVVAVVLVALLGLALSRLRRDGGRERDAAVVFAERRRDAARHRRDAETAYASGRHDEALLEAVRALSAGLVERELLHDSVGLTVLEATATAAARFPDHAADLQRLRVAFEETRYGERHADAATAAEALRTEELVRRSQPTGVGAPDTLPAVPS